MKLDDRAQAEVDVLFEAAKAIDVLDLAGSYIANPRRTMVPQSGILALAIVVERCWEICVEADVLVRALERTMPWSEPSNAEDQERVAIQVARFRELMSAVTQNFDEEKPQ